MTPAELRAALQRLEGFKLPDFLKKVSVDQFDDLGVPPSGLHPYIRSSNLNNPPTDEVTGDGTRDIPVADDKPKNE